MVVGAGLGLPVRTAGDHSYVTGVLSAVLVFGLGLAITVAPRTPTALGAVPDECAGLAPVVNDDVARIASLVTVEVPPAPAGFPGTSCLHPADLSSGIRTGVFLTAALCVTGGAIAAAGVRNPARAPASAGGGGADRPNASAAPSTGLHRSPRCRRRGRGISTARCGYGETMKMRTLGTTGVRVSPLCLGAMMFGAWGNTDHDDSIRIIHRAIDAGINFIDTADVYSAGESEVIVGKALASVDRSQMVLATKVHAPMGDDPNAQGNSRRWIIAECENSLRRLGTDYLDLYQVHRPDELTDVDDTLGALSDLLHAGKIRYFGSSTFPAEQIVEAQWVAERRGRERFRTEQPPYSILVRGIERDVLPTAQRYGMGVIPWSPLAGGWLSGRFGEGRDNTSHRAERVPDRYDLENPSNRRKLELVIELSELADETGVSMIELALAFVLEHPAVSAAIIGPRTLEQLEPQLSAPDVRLEQAVLDRIDEIVPPGTNVNPADAGWEPSVLANPSRRRRHR
jgi:aryl-alcohol dehydrogenase-like predicted oxidoreductase